MGRINLPSNQIPVTSSVGGPDGESVDVECGEEEQAHDQIRKAVCTSQLSSTLNGAEIDTAVKWKALDDIKSGRKRTIDPWRHQRKGASREVCSV